MYAHQAPFTTAGASSHVASEGATPPLEGTDASKSTLLASIDAADAVPVPRGENWEKASRDLRERHEQELRRLKRDQEQRANNRRELLKVGRTFRGLLLFLGADCCCARE
jgi:hypothetical protein